MEPPVNAHEEISRTIIYEVLITSCNAGAWYRNNLKQKFQTVLDIVDKPYGNGQEVMFRVLGGKHPVKFIKQQHCTVVRQHIATHKELMIK